MGAGQNGFVGLGDKPCLHNSNARLDVAFWLALEIGKERRTWPLKRLVQCNQERGPVKDNKICCRYTGRTGQ